MSEVRLWANAKEEEKYENLAGDTSCQQLPALAANNSSRPARPLPSSMSKHLVHLSCMQPVPADLFAIIKCTEKLERAYVRDGISAQEYEGACEKLIAQYKVLWGSMRDAVSASLTAGVPSESGAAGMVRRAACVRGWLAPTYSQLE
jgi:hypothetical protein